MDHHMEMICSYNDVIMKENRCETGSRAGGQPITERHAAHTGLQKTTPTTYKQRTANAASNTSILSLHPRITSQQPGDAQTSTGRQPRPDLHREAASPGPPPGGSLAQTSNGRQPRPDLHH
ncbi:hypothetical protein NHX12_013682 [Muraenolepis orangiensis]|uniref:Uncharacterized protein n=1 Tax=Muraenolepis orangiensis TaxID=630683 RepID=A0A9Q0D9X3_9TELE|nr:hypothetical protein NHX12_013682 [Muraenolepis orangiensis]